jgi:hypothetical protein
MQPLAAHQHATGSHLVLERGESRGPGGPLLRADLGTFIVADQQGIAHDASLRTGLPLRRTVIVSMDTRDDFQHQHHAVAA